MANRKRPSPTFEEIKDTIEPNLRQFAEKELPYANLNDKDDFEKAWMRYFEDKEQIQASVRTMKLTYNAYLFKSAGGRDITLDRETTAKEIARDKDQYIRRRAQRVDLPGVDTRNDRFTAVGKRKGKYIKARPDTVVRRKIRIAVLRDVRGRFVSRK